MSCHVVREQAAAQPKVLTLRSHPLRVALVGQPNVGKSVVFGRLTGRYVTVSNYPGTTVAITKGRALVGAEVCDVIDTPGVNALDGTISEDERITRDVISNGDADLVVQVADARNIRRALMLTSQIAVFGKPMILALNMVDEAFARGISIDAQALAEELGIPVIEMVAVEGRGFSELRDALGRAARPHVPVHATTNDRVVWAHQLTDRVRRVSALSLAYVQEAMARATRRPLTGLPILLVVLYALYLFVGVFGAQTLVKLLEDGLFGKAINPASVWLVDRFIPVPLIREFLVGEYGLITMGMTYSIAIVLPVVATFFLMFGFLEDSGYIPRLAIFCDRIFRIMGLNGKAVLPMVLGLGCDTMATMTTRILGTPKERLIAILLLALGIPCSAQLATIMGILGGISFAALATLFAVVLGQMILVGWLAARVLKGERSEFILELPPIRWPRLGNLLTKTRLRVWWYLGEAVPLFLVGTALLFVLDRIGALVWIAAAGRPIVTGLLGLPASTAQILVMGFLRRDYGAAGLFQLAHSGQLTGVQAVVALTVMTLFVPCVANFLMMVRERGLKTGLAIIGVITPVAILTGAGLNYVLRTFGVQF
ncbi:MAG TPA: ferrous iron transporter B [Vicinamibacterales bacterium]|nr:ferrous iron transporter B [Vicinamibacterales bacterium]